MKCSDVSSRLVDFLYEEMPAAERREFLTHVDSCASCGAEVKAMSSTLGHARAALRGPLAEEPPPGVRARVLDAARAAATARATEVAKPRVARPPEPDSFFARLWKTPWLVPALGAAGVATAVFLIKVIKNPQVLPEQKPAVTEALAPPAAEPQRLQQTQPQPETQPELLAAPAATPPGLAGRPTTRTERDSQPESKRAATAGKPRAAPPARDELMKSRRQVSDDPLSGIAWEARPRTQVGKATASKGGGRASAPSRGAADAIASRELAPAMGANTDDARLDEPLRPLPHSRKAPVAEGAGSSDRWAQPPLPRATEAPAAPVASAAAPVAAKPAQAEKAEAAADLEDRVGSRLAEEPPRSAPPAKMQARVRAAPVGPAGQAEAPADKKKVTANQQTLSFDERVRKAEKLFAEKKWAEAAAAFRALLAQAPSNPAAKTWRERVAAAESAQEQAGAAKAKKALSSDPLDGL
jgi:Putative zinc-finger